MISLLVDGNPLVFRSAYGTGTENHGVTSSVLNLLSDITSSFPFDNLAMFWDSGKSRWRLLCYPEYKAQREEKRKASDIDFDEVYAQAKDAQRYLAFHEIQQFVIPGVEADDMLAWVAEYRYQQGDTVIIATSDHDLWQLVKSDGQKQIICYDPMKKQWVNSAVVTEFFGISPQQIRDFKSLSGDTSDNIPGAKGVGPKTATSVLNEYSSLGNLFHDDVVKLLKKKKTTERILFHEDEVESAFRVVTIPSLNEAKFCLTNEEISSIKKQSQELPKVDPARYRIIVDRLGPLRLDPSRLPKMVNNWIPTNFIEISYCENYTLDNLDSSIKSCSKCKLRQCCGEYGPTIPNGFADAEIMIIGRNPGFEELYAGEPFVGKSGKRLDQVLEEVGLTRRECWITNVCKCFSEANRPVEFAEMTACLPYLRSEIALLKPKLILAFGNEAQAAVTPYGCSGISNHCGEILEPGSHGWVGDIESTVILFPHPSAALRTQKFETLMQFATTRLKQFLEDHPVKDLTTQV
jgi:uracil-DNA glycosylase family 4